MQTRWTMTAILGWRSIWRHRRRTIITVASIAFGVALVVFAVSLNEGVYAQLVDDAVRMHSGHLTFEHPDYRDAPAIDLYVDGVGSLRAEAEQVEGVESTKVLAFGQGIARSGSGAVGVAVMGVEPAVERENSPLARNIVEGDYLDDTDGARVVVGRALAERLKLSEGKKVVIASNDVHGDLVESLFRVRGIFETGSEEVDGYIVQAPIKAVRELYGLDPDQATQVGVLLADPDDQEAASGPLSLVADKPNVALRPWPEILPELNAFIRLDRVSDYTFEGMLIVLVLFTIFNTLLMSVVERERELTVLLAIGTPPSQLRLQVLVEAVFIGAIGCLLGVILGTAVGAWFQAYGLDVSGLYDEGVTISGMTLSTRIFAKLTPQIVATVSGSVFACTVVLGLLVMRRVGRADIADVLR